MSVKVNVRTVAIVTQCAKILWAHINASVRKASEETAKQPVLL